MSRELSDEEIVVSGKKRDCEVQDCGRDAIVGYGKDPVWLCGIHYEEMLMKVRASIEKGLGVFKHGERR